MHLCRKIQNMDHLSKKIVIFYGSNSKFRENDIHFRKSGIITNEIFDIEVVKIRFKIMSSITLLHILQRKWNSLEGTISNSYQKCTNVILLTIVTSDIGLDYEIKSYTTIKKYIFQGLNHVWFTILLQNWKLKIKIISKSNIRIFLNLVSCIFLCNWLLSHDPAFLKRIYFSSGPDD